MNKPLRLLIVEDSEDAATLLVRDLHKAGYEPELATGRHGRDAGSGPGQTAVGPCHLRPRHAPSHFG
jgi:hypothetical protein